MAQAKQAETVELSEAEAIRRAQRGDGVGFERLYRLHSRRVYALCLRMTTNTAEAEDLAQEAFLQVFRKLHTFRGDSAFSTWLHRLVVNIVLMRLRKKSLPATSLDEMTEPDEETGSPRKDLGASDVRLSGSIDRVNLQRAIDRLSPGYRTVFILHDFRDTNTMKALLSTLAVGSTAAARAAVVQRHPWLFAVSVGFLAYAHY